MKNFRVGISSVSKFLIRGFFTSLFLLLQFGSLSCSSAKSTYPSHWSPIIPDVSADYSGYYNEALIPLLSGAAVRTKEADCIKHFIINAGEMKYNDTCKGKTDSLSTAYVSICPNIKYRFRS
ncbi:hypothetical protein FK178_02675 [Antarcticibacterium arcticum]|uniref:Lipoprotein n=1 Tax=Antarcticibacterium arcticum TaxID=2585771 RepID=A0A5B8YJ78_9FLAO|nr:hypothetical protein [Antarcticibacterium arcticum]QED36683.1 hypothetical protein FK178_02675 [Antarcticibacterium arcticum]